MNLNNNNIKLLRKVILHYTIIKTIIYIRIYIIYIKKKINKSWKIKCKINYYYYCYFPFYFKLITPAWRQSFIFTTSSYKKITHIQSLFFQGDVVVVRLYTIIVAHCCTPNKLLCNFSLIFYFYLLFFPFLEFNLY